MANSLKITIYDTSIDRTEEYKGRWLDTDLYQKFLGNTDVGNSDIVGLNDCFGYRCGIFGLLLLALIFVLDRIPVACHLGKYIFDLVIIEGRYLGVWHRDPKTAIAEQAQVKSKYTVIAPEYRNRRKNDEDSGMLILVNKGSVNMTIAKTEYVAFAQNDASECGFISVSMNVSLEKGAKNILLIHARMASRPALKVRAFLKGYWTKARVEKFISEVLDSEIKEIADHVSAQGTSKDYEVIVSGDLNMGNLQNPDLQKLIQTLNLRQPPEVVTDVWDNTTFFPTPIQATQTYLLISKGLEYKTYRTLPEASFDKSESLVLYTETA